MEMTTKINCPKCGHEFNVEDVLAHRIEEKYREELGRKISELEKSFQMKEGDLNRREAELKNRFEEMDRRVEEKARAAARLKEDEIRKKVREDFEARLKALAEEGVEAGKKIEELKNAQIDNIRLRRQLDEQKKEIELDYERKLTERLKEKENAIRRHEQESALLKIRELEKKLEDQTKLAEEMKRKAEQGSTQLQGEVQEIELEKMLRDLYDREGDEIVEVKKGQRGADVLHCVKTLHGEECGKIYYESKRTKEFNKDWLRKLRDDNLEIKADALVLVTETMPQGRDRFFWMDGVWICSLWEVKGLSLVLRYGIVRAHAVGAAQHGKETKMELIYNYLTGNEFALQFGAILEGFKALQENYADEKLKMQKVWKEREKQLEKILTNAVHFYGSIRGIAGRSIPEMKMLEDVSGD